MKRKKTVLWRVLAVGAVTFTGGGLMAAQAAKEMIPRAQVGMLAERAQKQLSLTDDQRDKVRNILQDAIPKGINIHDNMKLAPEAKRKQLKELHDATKAKVYAVLTPTQRTKADNLRQNVMHFGKQKLEEIADQLELTSGQREKIKPILERRFKEGQALRDDMSLTVAQKFAKGMQIRDAMRAEVNEILTAEQRTELDKITKQMRTQAHKRFGVLREPK